MTIDHMPKSNIRPWRIAVVLAGVLLLPTLLVVSGCEVPTEEILQTKQIQKPPPPPRPPVPVEMPNDEILEIPKIPEKRP